MVITQAMNFAIGYFLIVEKPLYFTISSTWLLILFMRNTFTNQNANMDKNDKKSRNCKVNCFVSQTTEIKRKRVYVFGGGGDGFKLYLIFFRLIETKSELIIKTLKQGQNIFKQGIFDIQCMSVLLELIHYMALSLNIIKCKFFKVIVIFTEDCKRNSQFY